MFISPEAREAYIALSKAIQERCDPAPCAQADPDAFFPEKGEVAHRYVRQMCKACPVRVECLTFALENRERFGVFGGLTVKERQRLLRQSPASWPRR